MEDWSLDMGIDRLADHLRLLVITDPALLAGRDPIEVSTAAVQGGATAIQLRDKTATPRALFQMAQGLVAALPVPVFVNDRLDVALAAGAAGCHLGLDDVPATAARRAVPSGFGIGVSVGSPDEADHMRPAGATYWGIGPCYPTSTKPDAGEAIGPDGFATLRSLSDGTPCLGIGGITAENAPAIIRAGAAGVAVSSAVIGQPDPAAAATRLRQSVETALRASA